MGGKFFASCSFLVSRKFFRHYIHKTKAGEACLSSQCGWGFLWLFCLPHRGLLLGHTPVFWGEREKRGFGKCHHRAPSERSQKPLLNQLSHDSCSVQVLCYRGKGQIHLRAKTFCLNHLDLYLSKERNSLFSTSNMFTDVALKADVFTTPSLTPGSPPCYAHTSYTKCSLAFPFARLSKLISS